MMGTPASPRRTTSCDACRRAESVAEHTHNRGCGRAETRRLQITTVAGLDFPHATQAIGITCRVRPLHSQRSGRDPAVESLDPDGSLNGTPA
jgi:hypothetical protein